MQIVNPGLIGWTVSTGVLIGLDYLRPRFANWGVVAGLKIKKEKPKKIVIDKGMALDTAGYLLTNFLLAQVLFYAGAVNILTGAITAFWVWLGFFAFPHFKKFFLGKLSIQKLAFVAGYQLLSLMISGAILASI